MGPVDTGPIWWSIKKSTKNTYITEAPPNRPSLNSTHLVTPAIAKENSQKMGNRYYDVTTHTRPMAFIAVVKYDLYQLFFIEA